MSSKLIVTVNIFELIYKSLFYFAFLKLKTSWYWQLQYGIKNKLTVVFSLWKVLWKSLLLYCLTTFHWTLSKNIYESRLSISKSMENTSLHMSNTFLEAFLQSRTSWHWQMQYGKLSRNHCFYIVWQASIEHCLKIMMDLDCPHQNWGKTLYCTCQTHFWKHF